MTPLTMLLALGVASITAHAQEHERRTVETDKHPVRVETIAKGVEHPWGLALMPDGRFLVTERNAGRLRIGMPDGKLSAPVEGIPEVFRYDGPTDRSQGGLFHVALHPQFEKNRLVYFSYAQRSDEGAGTAVARGRLVELVEEGGKARLENVETVYTMNKHDSSGLHFGGRFAFHPDEGTLFITVGERRNISRAQDKEDHAGSVIRVKENGEAEVFSYGHRNPQGIAFHPQTNEAWINDHGPKGGDEINRLRPGANYGWPFQTNGVDYSGAPLGRGERVEGMEPPVHVFEKTVAPSGLAFYDGKLFPGWHGHMLHGALQGEGIIRIRIENGKVAEEEWISLGRRIRDVQVAPDGAIWLITEHEDGEVLRLTPEQ